MQGKISEDDINQHIAMLEAEYEIELDGHDKVQIIRFIDDMSGKIEEEMGRWEHLRRKARKTKSKARKAK